MDWMIENSSIPIPYSLFPSFRVRKFDERFS
jgi:hypothetical protein